MVFSGYKKSENNKTKQLTKQLCSSIINDVKYVKKKINIVDKFINKHIDRYANVSKDNSLINSDSNQNLDLKLIKKLDKSNSFLVEKKAKNHIKYQNSGNYAKYIDNPKINKNKSRILINNSNSLIDNSFDIANNNPNLVDHFTFNSHKLTPDKENENKDKRRDDDFKPYRSSEYIHKRNRIIDDNSMFCLSFSRNHNLTYSNAEMKKFFNCSLNELFRNRNKSSYNYSPCKKKLIKNSFTNTKISINNTNYKWDVETVEDLHYLFIGFYKKNKNKAGEKLKKRNFGNSVILLDEQEINV